jgi:prepilin-type processing-associated H-X9-DG protein
VVVAIIALLISILLPSLSRARAEAKNVVCQSNARQLGVGMRMYVDSHQGYYADPDRWLTWQPWYWAPDPAEYTAPKANPQSGRQEGQIFRYVKNPQAFLCPMDNGYRAFADSPGDFRSQPPGHTNFAMNGVLQELVTGRMAQIMNTAKPGEQVDHTRRFRDSILTETPSRVMLMAEESELAPCNDGLITWEGYWQKGFREQMDKVTTRHFGKGNLLMFDGHVEGVLSEKDFNKAGARASCNSGRLYGALYADRGSWKIRTRPEKQPTDPRHAAIGQP